MPKVLLSHGVKSYSEQKNSPPAVQENNQSADKGENKATGCFCMAEYYNYGMVTANNEDETVDKEKKSLARNAIDTATRTLEKTGNIINAIKEGNLNQIFFTNKHLGTTAFLTMLSRNYKKYRFLRFGPEKGKHISYYKQLEFFVTYYLKSGETDFGDNDRELINKFFDLIINEETILCDVAEMRRVLIFCGRDKLNMNHSNWNNDKSISEICEKLPDLGNGNLKKLLTAVGKLYQRIKDYIRITYNDKIDKDPIANSVMLKNIKRQCDKLNKEFTEFVSKEEKYKKYVRIWGEGYENKPAMILIDDFDYTIVELFNKGKVKLKNLHKLRNAFINEINKNNIGENGDARQFVLILRKRFHANEHEGFCAGCNKTSLRNQWKYSYFNKNKGCFFIELLCHIKNIKEISIFDGKYYCKHSGAECPLRIDKSLLSRIDTLISKNDSENYDEFLERLEDPNNNEKNEIDKIIGGRLGDLVDKCEGNPHFVIRPIIQVLKDNYCLDVNKLLHLDNNVKAYFKHVNGWDYDDSETLEKINSHSFADFFDMLPLYLSESLQNSGKDFLDSKCGVNSIEDVKKIAGKWLACMIRHICNKKGDGNGIKDGDVCTTLSRYAYKDKNGAFLSKKERKYLENHKEAVSAIVASLIDCHVICREEGKNGSDSHTRMIKISKNLLESFSFHGRVCKYRRINNKNYKGNVSVRIYRLNQFIRYVYSDNKIFEKKQL